MANRSTLINMLLLAALTGVYLVSGSIQCAVDCLTRIDDHHPQSIRVDDCHFVNSPPQTTEVCPNKACHQTGPRHGRLGSPAISGLERLLQPLASAPQQQTPEFKTGSAYRASQPTVTTKLLAATPVLATISQQQRSLRTTVLLN